MKLTSPKKVKELINTYDLRVKKNYGQNFIIDENILNKIIKSADLNEEDTILEIGPGIGTLTEALARKVNNVIAIEIDKNIIYILRDTILKEYNNVTLIEADALKINIKDQFENIYDNVPGEIKVVANLPYYITTPLLIKLAQEQLLITEMVLTVQKEAADRFMAENGTKDYGSVTVVLDYYFEKDFIMKLSPAVFYPRPKVDSAVIRLKKHSEPPVKVENENSFVEFIRKCFSQRRKTLKNNLKSFSNCNLAKRELDEIFEKTEINERARPEDLDLFKFARIFNMFYNRHGEFF
ncbi:16S rRNA (adenine(1518)-N(6)/adenine(1519)-N(6))-dimethyltransferase RsmA [Natranaerofaba carboxydovora]|uniref:16S rRNA (adenine(1518)-N(6)/adenine(1519)-N(6))- dimethyltransferase RsmA n=1 Tax=Natranaerofaba carboxydovora TaxID=2742683 RepID=UPI001F12E01D|nr:16S rRNA (adenine(1518)-N(6)/adenine(1519)-N(6))-dimethyltransferase RsmA [Natranaerofaba carboxydovora]UMZ75250.1 Ribosomal RNA small subunit methyltransferase A [Natranaerofaba carboxydovora]